MHLSPSQAGRRRQRLESEGYIQNYTARLDATKLGLNVQGFIQVHLGTHGRQILIMRGTQISTQHFMERKVDSKVLESGTNNFLTVTFDVVHEDPGQYEYTFKVRPIPNERELSNNSATTYLNVISERIQILEIEGRPFWDSTFLRRSFSRNDKFDIDSLVAFTNDRVRPISSNDIRDTDKLKPPTNVDDLKSYNIVILGREVERVIGNKGILAIKNWVKDHGGILIFSRGKAWTDNFAEASDLEPIDWATDSHSFC